MVNTADKEGLFLIVGTIGEGNAGDPTTFDTQRQTDVARDLGLPLATVQARWIAIDLTGTTLAYAVGEHSILPEQVYSNQLQQVERALQQRGESLAQMTTILLFDENVEGCHTINAGFALAVRERTSMLPRLIGIQYSDISQIWLLTESVSLLAETPPLDRRERLVSIPMSVGPEMLLAEVLSTYLFRQKKDIDDTSVVSYVGNVAGCTGAISTEKESGCFCKGS